MVNKFYQKHKGKLRKETCESYPNLFEEEKEKKCRYHSESKNKNLSEEEEERKKVKYMKIISTYEITFELLF